MIKTPQEMGIKGIYLNIINICDKSMANTIHNGEKLKAFPLRSETRQGCPLLSQLFNTVLKVLTMLLREEKEMNPEWKRSKTLNVCRQHYTIHLFSSSLMSNSLQPHESQHARPPCASPTPRVHSNACPLSR